jgi:hypothetical protein
MNPYRRSAIGLVELMVAMALTIGIMWILAESFKTGLDMTRELRSTTQMVNHLDGARAIMTHDLSQDHFPRDDNRFGGGTKLSHQRLDWLTQTDSSRWSPPKGGFFRIMSPPPSLELDSEFNTNTSTTCALHFTSILPPTERNLYTVKAANGNTYSSRAAEIAYFPVAMGTSTPSGRALYKLVRRQRLVALSDDEKSQLSGGVTSPEVIAGNGTNLVYSLAEIRDPSNRLPISPVTIPPDGTLGSPPVFPSGFYLEGTDLLLTNVLSFEVQVDWTPSGVTGCTNGPRGTALGNWDYPFDSLARAANQGCNSSFNATVVGLFDTWHPVANWNGFGGNTAIPLAVRVKQLRIILRIFDTKTMQTRQSSFVVEM